MNESHGAQGAKKQKKSPAALAALAGMGIEADARGVNWIRLVQGVCQVEGIQEPVQARICLAGGPKPPSINPHEESQAQVVLDWFEAQMPRAEALEKAGSMLADWLAKAQAESPEDASRFSKTAQKLLQSGEDFLALAESLETAHAQWSANWRIRRQASELEVKLSLDAYPELFPLARSLKREIEIFTGPTNSGKTYAGMQLLAKAQSGAYLAPLRLLAMEGQEAMQERGLSCSLVTGEERRLIPGACFVASTVEMADFGTVVDVAVIDEAQMLADKDRGWAWTAAICGLPAKKLAIVCAPEAVGMVQALLARTGESSVVHSFERKTPLEAMPKPMSIDQLQDGDALIAFSRKNALMWRDKVVAMGKSVSVIYGALAPEVRRGEAKRFAEGAAQILVATDAIGMGLNLPIKRIVFTTASKFDGQETRELAVQEVRQIAGRAGRFGVAEKGFAAAMDPLDCKIIASALAGAVIPLVERASIAPNDRQVQQMGSAMQTTSLGPILAFFRDHLVKSDNLFKASEMEDMMDLAWRADRRIGLDLNTRFAYAKTPLDRNDFEHVKAWESWMRAHEQGQTIKAPIEPTPAKSSRDEDKLWEGERAMKLLSAYCWLSWRFESVFNQRDLAEKARAVISEKIEGMLSRMSAAKHGAKPGPGKFVRGKESSVKDGAKKARGQGGRHWK